MEDDLIYIIMLARMRGIGAIRAKLLMETFGSARSVLEADAKTLEKLPYVGHLILEQRNEENLRQRAEKELEFNQVHHIHTLVYGQKGYPKRLLDCPDAPALLHYLGNANLDSKHVLSIVGTRKCTQYGRDMVNELVAHLKEEVPDLIIVSGLALGIDITSHKAALANNIPTVGVVAHGLDRIYPTVHRSIASEMVAQGGGIITEYFTGTEPERGNFLARNRIIAGLSDAILVAESKSSGGSLVTASIGIDYDREVFAFPGRAKDDRSQGCNRLIRLNRAGLITCAKDLLEAMGWENKSVNQKAIQQSIPFEEENLTPAGRLILDTLRDKGDLRTAQISAFTGLDISVLLEELLDLEMNNKIRQTPGGIYQLKSIVSR